MKQILTFCWCIFFAIVSNAQPYTLEELHKKFKPENYSEQVLLEFSQSIEHLEEKPSLYEYIPGEIIAWSLMDGRFLLHSMFLIQNDTMVRIEALPNDETFLSKLNSYVPEESRFIFRENLWTLPAVKEKLPDLSYLIIANVKSYNRYPEEPSPDILTYNLEYTTHDFKKFRLVRLKDIRSDQWIEVGDY